MKKYAITLLCALYAFPIHARISDDTLNFYVGVHGNISKQSAIDDYEFSTSKDGQNLDNGDTRSSILPSVTAGIEFADKIFETNSLKWLIGGEFFFDYINKTIVQGDAPYDWDGWILQRPMAGKPIYKTNFLTGLRAKLGLRLFRTIDVYGHAGITYWDRNLYIQQLVEDPDYPGELANWKFMPSWGAGMTVHITDGWAVNANYMNVMESMIAGVAFDNNRNNYNYDADRVKIGIQVFTLGIQYHF